ncbi:MAG: FAD-dependent oxidoreductase, partial [Verrucomicrobiota bacterium]|nr:FAD-dependent oxidoreductase [Verrucomicrobiota bacterium]
LMLEKNGLPGGQIMLTEDVENYPGYQKIGGFDLIERMKAQVLRFGAEIAVNRAVTSLRRRDDGLLELEINAGERSHVARAIILSPGSDYRVLGVPGEQQMRQATRVSYCATCDGAFYRDKHVLTVGGGNTAVQDTIYLAERFVRKATMIHRRREFRAQMVLVEELHKVAADKGIDIKLPYVLEEIVPNADGAEIDHVRIRNVETDATEQVKVDGVFVFAGMTPNTAWLREVVEMDEAGYIVANPLTMRTSMPGVFVAGDCRRQAAMQLATACADGVVAAMMLREYFRDPSAWPAAGVGEVAQGR